MTTSRGIYASGTKTRMRLIEAASELLAEEGYQAMSTRRIAARANVKPQLVHYYFQSMEDLIVTVFRRSHESYGQLHEEALSAANPLRAIWQLNSNLPEARQMFEYVALGRQYPALRRAMRESGEAFRKLQIEAIAKAYERRGFDDPEFSPSTLALLMSAVARSLVIEGQVGMTSAHAEIHAFLERFISRFDSGNSGLHEPCIRRQAARA